MTEANETSRLNDETQATDEAVTLDLTDAPKDNAPPEVPERPAEVVALFALEADRAEMLRRADEAEAAVNDLQLEREIKAAETALEGAESNEILRPGKDAEAAVVAAQGRLDDVRKRRDRLQRSVDVLRAEADRIKTELVPVRSAAHDVVSKRLERIRFDAAARLELKITAALEVLRHDLEGLAAVAPRLGKVSAGKILLDEELLKTWLGYLGVNEKLAPADAREPIRSLYELHGYTNPNPHYGQAQVFDQKLKQQTIERAAEASRDDIEEKRRFRESIERLNSPEYRDEQAKKRRQELVQKRNAERNAERRPDTAA